MMDEVVRCLDEEVNRRFLVLLADLTQLPFNKPEMRETPDVNRLILEKLVKPD